MGGQFSRVSEAAVGLGAFGKGRGVLEGRRRGVLGEGEGVSILFFVVFVV